MESFGNRLAELRKDRNMTQQDIADKLNVTYQAVSKWENDLTAPDIDSILKLADILEVSTDVLLGKAKKETSYLPELTKEEINRSVLRIKVSTVNGDKVNINFPVSIIKLIVESGAQTSVVSGIQGIDSIDFSQIITMIDSGIVGELMTVETAEGDHVSIAVERQ